MTTFNIIFPNIPNHYTHVQFTILGFLQIYYILQYFFKKRTLNIKLENLQGGLSTSFLYRQNPPHPTTVLWHCPDIKSNNSYFSPAPSTTLPTLRFFSRKLHSKIMITEKNITFNTINPELH